MKYLLMIYQNEAESAARPEAEQNAEMGEYFGLNTWLQEKNAFIAGEALHPIRTATTVRVRDGKTLTTDGPFAETKEQLGGYYTVEAKDLDEAIAFAAKIPGARIGSIEIRPIVQFG